MLPFPQATLSFLPLHFKEKPILDLQDLDYQPEENDDEDDDAPQDDDPPDPRPGALEREEEVLEARPEGPASVDAEPTEKKVKEKKEREPTFVRTLLRPISKPIHVS